MSEPGPRIVRALVTGRVQGVGFRWNVQIQARSLDVAGTVRNRLDGSVEVVAKGSPDAVEALLRFLRAGPPGARVGSLTVEDADDVDLPDRFEIR